MKIYTQPNVPSQRRIPAEHRQASTRPGVNDNHSPSLLQNLIPFALCISVLGWAIVLSGCTGMASSSGKTDNSLTAPATPAAVTAKPGNATVSLGWPVVVDATIYHVKRSKSPSGTFTQVASTPSPSYTDTGLTNGTKYFYVISAANSEGESANSTPLSATPKAAAATAPSPVHLNATAGNALVNLSWTAEAGATGYHVYDPRRQDLVHQFDEPKC